MTLAQFKQPRAKRINIIWATCTHIHPYPFSTKIEVDVR